MKIIGRAAGWRASLIAEGHAPRAGNRYWSWGRVKVLPDRDQARAALSLLGWWVPQSRRFQAMSIAKSPCFNIMKSPCFNIIQPLRADTPPRPRP